jgi:hypothetical protein
MKTIGACTESTDVTLLAFKKYPSGDPIPLKVKK